MTCWTKSSMNTTYGTKQTPKDSYSWSSQRACLVSHRQVYWGMNFLRRKTQQTCICPEQIHTRTVETQNKTYTIFPGRRRLWRKIYLTRTCRAFKTGPRRTLQSHHRLDGHKHENMVRQENLVFESQRYLNIK